jgi:hypothetical protein
MALEATIDPNAACPVKPRRTATSPYRYAWSAWAASANRAAIRLFAWGPAMGRATARHFAGPMKRAWTASASVAACWTATAIWTTVRNAVAGRAFPGVPAVSGARDWAAGPACVRIHAEGTGIVRHATSVLAENPTEDACPASVIPKFLVYSYTFYAAFS